MNRREFVRTTVAAGLGMAFAPLLIRAEERRFKIGACEWSLGASGKSDPATLEIAKKIGLDGMQVNMGWVKDNMCRRKPEVQQAFLAASKRTGVALASLAVAEMNSVPLKKDPRAAEWLADSVGVATALGVRVVLVPAFGKACLLGDKSGIDHTVTVLKKLAPKAEKAGVIFGLENYLSAAANMDIIQRVGSPAVKVYYDVCNSTDKGYDIYKEIRWLGTKQICEFHMKENGALLGKGKADFQKVRAALDDIGYTGWMQIESAVPKGMPMLDAYKANLKFLQGVFS
jgi:sugar phosphate isomerase/epimerase